MKLIRIDREKNLDKEVVRVELKIDGIRYVFTDDISGGIRVQKDSLEGTLQIQPCVSNEIIIK